MLDSVLNHPEEHVFLVILTLVTIVLGVGRLTRVLVHDDFPPAIALRMLWARITNDGPWNKLLNCWWCASFWVTLVCIGTGYFTGLAWYWWLVWGALALSYVSAIVISRDEPAETDES